MTDSVSQNMSHTYRFDVSVCIGPISSLLTSANHSKTFCMLRTRDATASCQNSTQWTGKFLLLLWLPDEGLEKISGYVHVNKTSCLYESAVRTWILDDRISEEITSTPVLQKWDWKQHPLIKSTLAALESAGCDGGTRRLEDWVGYS